MDNTPTITRCAASRGWLWWREAFFLVKDEAAIWYAIGAAYSFMMMLAVTILSSLLVAIAPSLALLSSLPLLFVPCFIVGFIAAAWSQARGRKPEFKHLFAGFRADVKTLLLIGAFSLICSLLINYFFSPFALPEYTQLMGGVHDTESAQALLTLMTSSSFLMPMLIWATLLTLLFMAMWLAPAIVVFQHAGATTALIGSMKGVVANWRALTVYITVPLLFALGISIALSLLSVLFVLLLGNAGAALMSLAALLVLVAIPWLVSLSTLTSFVAYCDIFHAEDEVFPRQRQRPVF
jgi:Predicted membrane-associated, metal-dependent hydrolase